MLERTLWALLIKRKLVFQSRYILIKGKVILCSPQAGGSSHMWTSSTDASVCVDFTASECCGVFLPIVVFPRFTLQCSFHLSEGRLCIRNTSHCLKSLLRPRSMSLFLQSSRAVQGSAQGPFPYRSTWCWFLALPVVEKRPSISDLLMPAPSQDECWARRASPICGSLPCNPNVPAQRGALASQNVPRKLEKPPLPILWPPTAQPFSGEWHRCPKKPGHLLGSVQERALELYFSFRLMAWVNQHKYLGVEHTSREMIVVIILCRLFSRVSIQEGFEITSPSD